MNKIIFIIVVPYGNIFLGLNNIKSVEELSRYLCHICSDLKETLYKRTKLMLVGGVGLQLRGRQRVEGDLNIMYSIAVPPLFPS